MDINYIIFDTSEIDVIDFNQVKETSADTLRKSIDGQFTFVKWEGEMPSFISNLISRTKVYNQQEMLEILQTPEWSIKISGTTN
jgi:hypothetical protein